MSSTRRPIDESTVEALLRERYARQGADAEPAELGLVARYLDGALSGAERARAEAVLAADPELAETVALARDAGGEQKVVSLAAARRERKRPPIAFVMALAAAVLAVVGVSVLVGKGGPGDGEPQMSGAGVGAAGSDRLVVQVTDAAGETALLSADGALPAAGDTLTLEHASKLEGFAMVVELDASGALRVLFPADATAAGGIGAARRDALGAPVKVGDHAGCAWIVGIFAHRGFERSQLDAALAQAAAAAGPSCTLGGLEGRLDFARSVEALTIHR